MRTRAHDPPPVSLTLTRVTRNSLHSSSPAKAKVLATALTAGKLTRSITSLSAGSSLAYSDHMAGSRVAVYRDENLFVFTGLNPDLLQLYESADQKQRASKLNTPSTANQRAERRARRQSAHDALSTALSNPSPRNLLSKRKRSSQAAPEHDPEQTARASRSKQQKRALDSEDDQDPDEDADGSDASPRKQLNPSSRDSQDDYDQSHAPPPKSAIPLTSKRGGIVKRRRRGGAHLASKPPSRDQTPPPDILPPEQDVLGHAHFPSPFTDELYDDPTLPDDEAQALYKKYYEPMTRAALFVDVLTKYAPAQRSTENLYAMAANTAAALRAWQDEYLELEKITAPHAAIPRKPAHGQRRALDPIIFEDQKESELYDYVYDAKKPGYQDPLAQRVVRDASGRELRTRAPRAQSGINAANVVEDVSSGRRPRKPVTRFDGAQQQAGSTMSTRKRGLAASETPEVEQPAPKRGRLSGRGRGGRGRGRGGGRGGLLGQRIRELRAESVASTSAPPSDYDEEASDSDVGRSSMPPQSQREESLAADVMSSNETPAPEEEPQQKQQQQQQPQQQQKQDDEGEGGEGAAFSADGVSLTASGKRKGRPKGSKNHHKRSDAGIPKGPRQPRPPLQSTASRSPLAGSPSADSHTYSVTPLAMPAAAAAATPTAPTTTAQSSTDPKKKAPRSEKRSQSMVEWWARRKAKAAEEKAVQKQREQAEAAERARAHAAAMQTAHAQAGHLGLPPMHHPQYGHQYGAPAGGAYGGMRSTMGEGGYVSPFGPPPPPGPQHTHPHVPPASQPPAPAEYRSPFGPPPSAQSQQHHPYLPPHMQQQPPPPQQQSGTATPVASAPHTSGGPSLPSLGQTIGHGLWSAYTGPQGAPGVSPQQQPPPGSLLPHTHAQRHAQQLPPPLTSGSGYLSNGQQQAQQGQQGNDQQQQQQQQQQQNQDSNAKRDQHGFVRSF